MRKLVLFILLLPALAYAQKEISLYGLKHVPQIVYFNPALAPNGRLNIGVPGISSLNASVGRSDFLVSDLFTTNSNGEEEFNTEKFVNGLQDDNEIFFGLSNDILHVGFASGKNYFHFNITERVDFNASFPKEAAVFIKEVYDENYLNQNVSVENISIGLQHHREIGFGMSRNINEKLRVGGTVKILAGIGRAQTKDLDFIVDTDLSNDSIVGGIVAFDIESSGIDEYSGDDPAAHIMSFDNMGFAMDLGVNYKFNERFEVSASILDMMSSINWTKNNRNFESDGVGAEVSLLSAEELFEDREDDGLSTALDSLQKAFEESENDNSFTTTVPTRVNFVASYNPNSKTQISLISHNILYEDSPRNYLKAVFNGRLNKVLNGVVSYAIIDEHETPLNLGLGFAVNLGFFQLHALTENALVAFVSPDESKNPNLRFGINFTFARDNQ